MKHILFLFIAVLFSACSNSNTSSDNNSNGRSNGHCSTQSSCENDPKCECWCSQKCGFRKKEKTDHPVYVENDRNGKHCYCKQWDIDKFEENCKEGKKIKEPAGAK